MLNTKRILAALLTALMLTPAMAACSDESASNPSDTTAPFSPSEETTAPAETEPPVTDRADIKDDLPADLNLGGKKITVLTRNGTYRTLEIDGGGSETGDVVNDAVYKRTRKVEERLNFTLEVIENTEGYKQTATQVQNSVNANDNLYQFVNCSTNGTMNNSMDYLFQPIQDLQYLNFDQPWWWKDAMYECSLDGETMKYLIGDVNLTCYNYSGAVLFNKTLFEKGIGSTDDLYKLVIDRKWTIDKLGEYAAQLYQDVNGNSQVDIEDIQGFYIDTFEYVKFLDYASDVRRYSRTADGYPVIDYDIDRASTVADKLITLIHNTNGVYWDSAETSRRRDLFAGGKNVFWGTILGDAYNGTVREMTDAYGIIPYPMVDDKQTEYNTYIHNSAGAFSIPTTNAEPELTAAVIEALCAESYRSVIEVYFETGLKTKYSSDSMSAQCVDIIKQVAKKYILPNYNVATGGTAYFIADQVKAGTNTLASTYAAKAETGNNTLKKLIESIE